ncbi:MAG TPA: TraR/DksA C4-type zinc finger protein [Planctomycetota bacterium]|nr:TraR/DksA C4-type zinc finger protein [Planctomycetota bacterium]
MKGSRMPEGGDPRGGDSRSSLHEFEELLKRRKEALLGDVKGLEDGARHRGGDSGELSSLPVHLADLASDAFEQDFSFERAEGVSQEIQEIEEALERIRDRTFGICESCQAEIPLERLRAIPYARLCVACKREEEDREG